MGNNISSGPALIGPAMWSSRDITELEPGDLLLGFLRPELSLCEHGDRIYLLNYGDSILTDLTYVS